MIEYNLDRAGTRFYNQPKSRLWRGISIYSDSEAVRHQSWTVLVPRVEGWWGPDYLRWVWSVFTFHWPGAVIHHHSTLTRHCWLSQGGEGPLSGNTRHTLPGPGTHSSLATCHPKMDLPSGETWLNNSLVPDNVQNENGLLNGQRLNEWMAY